MNMKGKEKEMEKSLLLKKSIALLLSVSMILGSGVAGIGTEGVYADNAVSGSKGTHWADGTMTKLNEKGLLKGDERGFRPDENITRAEFIAFVNRFMDYKEAGDVSAYKDVNPKAWYAKEIAIGVKAGYINGTSKDTMSPESPITNEQMFTILSKLSKASGEMDLSAVKDKGEISSWAKSGIAIAIANGYVTGYQGKINPKKAATRAQAMTVLDRVKENKRVIAFPGVYKIEEASEITVLCDGVELIDSKIKGDLILKGEAASIYTKNVKVEGKVLKEVGGKLEEKSLKDLLPKNKDGSKKLKDGTYEGMGKGYGGDMKLRVVIKDGKISELKILSHNETPSYITMVEGFMKKIVEQGNIENIDAVTGATKTSDAIFNAIKDVYSQASGETAKPGESKESQTSSGGGGGGGSFGEVPTGAVGGLFRDGKYQAFAVGYRGPIQVEVEIYDAKIKSVKILQHKEDRAYFSVEREALLLKRITDRGNVDRADAVSNATVSSNGVLAAVEKALKQSVDPNSNMAQQFVLKKNYIMLKKDSEFNADVLKKELNLQGVTVNIKDSLDTSVIGSTNINVQLVFSDNSKKDVVLTIEVHDDQNKAGFKSLDELRKHVINYINGVYYGDATGFVSLRPIPIRLTVEGNKIKSIEKLPQEIEVVDGVTKIDDGEDYEKRFGIVNGMLLNNPQRVHEILYTFIKVDEVTNKIVNEAQLDMNNLDSQDSLNKLNSAFDSVLGMHRFAGREITVAELTDATGTNARKTLISIVRKYVILYVSNYMQYDTGMIFGVDTIAGATFTATGTAKTVQNALDKMGQDVVGIKIAHTKDSAPYRIPYIKGESLDMSGLKVVLQKKDGTEVEVEYSDFNSNNLELYNFQTGQPVVLPFVLDESNLGTMSTVHGLYLAVRHVPSGSWKRLKTILIKPTSVALKDTKLQVQPKGDSQWYDTIGVKGEKDGTRLHIYIPKVAYDKIKDGEPPKFRRFVEGVKGQPEYYFEKTSREGWQNNQKYLNFDITYDDLSTIDGSIYTIEDMYLSLKLHPYDAQIDASQNMAENYKFIPQEPVTLIKNQPFTDAEATALFENLFHGTVVTIEQAPDFNEENTTTKIKLTFSDKSSKVVDIAIKVKDSTKALDYEKYFKQNQGSLTLDVLVKIPDAYKENAAVKKAVKAFEVTPEYLVRALKIEKIKYGDFSIESIETNNDELTSDASAKTKLKLKFADDNSVVDLVVSTKIVPLNTPLLEPDISKMHKVYAGSGTIYDLDKMELANVKISTSIEPRSWGIAWNGKEEDAEDLSMNIPYKDFKYFGVKLMNRTQEFEVTADVKVKTLTDADGNIKLKIDNGGAFTIDVLGISLDTQTLTAADQFKNQHTEIGKLYTFVKGDYKTSVPGQFPFNKDMVDAISNAPAANIMRPESIERDLKLNDKAKASGLKITKIESTGVTDDQRAVVSEDSVTTTVTITFDDDSKAVYDAVPVVVKPIPLIKVLYMPSQGKPLSEYVSGGKINFDNLVIFSQPYKVKSTGEILAESAGGFMKIAYCDFEYFGLELISKKTQTKVENGADLAQYEDGGKVELELKYKGNYVISTDYNEKIYTPDMDAIFTVEPKLSITLQD